MERARDRKSKICTVTEGYRQNQKQRTAPKLASDSSSCSGGTTEDDMATFELAQSSSRRVSGTPMKELLAEEMSKETEARRRSPSVIARLMGLDGLPSPQPGHRQQKWPSDSHQQRTASVGFQRNGHLYGSRPNRTSSLEQQEFKDVYEDLEASHIANRRYSSKWNVVSKFTKPEVAFNQKKFVDAKHLSIYEKLQGSKGFPDTPDTLDSNKDLMLKFHQQPDYLFVKHLRDVQRNPSSSRGDQISILKPSNAAKYEGNAKGWKSQREISCKPDIRTHHSRVDGLLLRSYNSRCVQNSVKSSKVPIEGKDRAGDLPTRIVILKPNLWKARNGNKPYVSDCRKHTEYSSVGTRDAGSWINEDLSNDVGFSRAKYREAREIAKEITKQMRENFSSGPINLSYSGSHFEVMKLTYRNSIDRYDRQKHSSFGSTESSVSREAKKRLSERWNLTHSYQDVEVVGRGRTLGEMLANRDMETRRGNLDAIKIPVEASDGYAGSNGSARCDNPVGISSRDGWKDECVRGSSRSRKLPPQSFDRGIHRTVHEAFDDQYVMPKEAISRGRSKLGKANLGQKKDLSSKNSRYSRKKSHSSCHTYTDNTDSLPEAHFSQIQVEINFNKKDLSEQQPLVSQFPANSDSCASSVIDVVADSEHEIITISSKSFDEFPGSGDSSARDEENLNLQEPLKGPSEGNSVALQCPCPEPEPESSVSSQEADHPSPVSVLEAPFTEDVSTGSECFERVSAGLQGLRMQLQLLKMESESYAETPMPVSTNEDFGQGSIHLAEEKEIYTSENWESSYMVDVLIVSGFTEIIPEMLTTIWYSPECPLGPWVFDNLEKKYCDEITDMRSERRLQFDRINSALLEMCRMFNDPYPWVKPTSRIGAKCIRGIKDELHDLLANQEQRSNEDATEMVLDLGIQWSDFRADVDAIGREIEKLMVNELITEVVFVSM